MAAKLYDVCGFGSAIVDVIYQTPESDFAKVGYPVESYGMIDDAEHARVTQLLKNVPQKLLSGGSVGNSMIALAQLGGRSAFVCVTGDDEIGKHYQKECRDLGINLGTTAIPGATTSSAFVLVTPDGKRTMRWYPGVAPQLRAQHVKTEVIAASRWLFIEGYLFLLGPEIHAAIHKAIADAKSAGTKIALTVSDSIVVNLQREALEAVLPSVDLLFANEVEGPALSGTKTPKEAFDSLRKRFASVVITAGAEGAYVAHDGVVQHVPTTKCVPVDLTGAGDMFAGSFFYGITSGVAAPQAAHGANALAREVISRVGPRLMTGTREYWDRAMTSRPNVVAEQAAI
jgi:sugar/nucleoside kinase (ribokinase family)